MEKNYIFYFTQFLFGIYCIYLSNSFGGLFFLMPIGIISIILCLGALIKIKFVIILNILFFAILLVIYAALFFDLLIIRGFIRNLSEGFLLMGAALHVPIICYSIFAFIFMLFKIKKTN